jgi:hypothetical protein
MAIPASGPAVMGAAGRGALEDSALEASNANVPKEFSELIMAQRPFEASIPSAPQDGTLLFDGVPEDGPPDMLCKTSARGRSSWRSSGTDAVPLRGEKPGNEVCRDC